MPLLTVDESVALFPVASARRKTAVRLTVRPVTRRPTTDSKQRAEGTRVRRNGIERPHAPAARVARSYGATRAAKFKRRLLHAVYGLNASCWVRARAHVVESLYGVGSLILRLLPHSSGP